MNDFKILKYLACQSHNSLRIILGLRGNESLHRLYLNSIKSNLFNVNKTGKTRPPSECSPTSCLKSTGLSPIFPKPRKAFEDAQVVAEGLRNYFRLNGVRAFTVNPFQVQQEDEDDIYQTPQMEWPEEWEKDDENLGTTEKFGQQPETSSQVETSREPENIVTEQTSVPPVQSRVDLHLKEIKTEPEQKTDVKKEPLRPVLLKYERKQSLSERSKERRVPSTRFERVASFGGLAASLGYSVVKDLALESIGLKKRDPKIDKRILSEENARKIVDTLCKTRGASLKIAQMLSLQNSNLINSDLQAIFERVRQSADFMPYKQMKKVLNQELGNDWQSKLRELDTKPFAAASIGQVHRAVLHDGTEVAMKIQYPGVAESIESDIKNLVSLLKMWNFLPEGLFIDNVVKVGRKELAWEVDYTRELECMKRFRTLIEPMMGPGGYYVPQVYDDLSTRRVLTAEMITGISVDKLETIEGVNQEIKNSVARRMLKLCLTEIFLFHFMQTDPNWSNFFYQPETDTLALLDFGACREYDFEFVDKYMDVIHAAALGDRVKVLQASKNIGFLTGYESKMMEEAHVDSVIILGEAFSYEGEFDFGSESTSERILELVPVMVKHRLTPPPEETYSLHRKMSGVFLLCSKFKVKLNCKKLFDETYNAYLAAKAKRTTHSSKIA